MVTKVTAKATRGRANVPGIRRAYRPLYVTDIRMLDEIRDARLKQWPKGDPSSAIVEVAGIAFPELLVEISARHRSAGLSSLVKLVQA